MAAWNFFKASLTFSCHATNSTSELVVIVFCISDEGKVRAQHVIRMSELSWILNICVLIHSYGLVIWFGDTRCDAGLSYWSTTFTGYRGSFGPCWASLTKSILCYFNSDHWSPIKIYLDVFIIFKFLRNAISSRSSGWVKRPVFFERNMYLTYDIERVWKEVSRNV